MTVPSNVAFQSLAIVATEAIDLEDRSSVVDEEGAYSRIATTGNGAVTVGVTAHSGTVFAGGNVFLRNYSHIHGDIVAKGGLVPEPQEGSAVDGTVSTGITTPARTRVMRRATFSSQTQPGISLEPEVVWTTPVAPGRYAELTLKRASQVTLRAGDYLFNRVNLDTGCRLKIDDSEGTVNLYVQDGIAIKGEISSVDGGFPNLTVSLLGTESVLATAPFRGALIAPNATINLERLDNGARHEGVFYGRRVRVAPDMTVVHHPIPLLIGDIDIDKTTVCSGESYRIAVSTADPANNGAPATVEIDGTQTAVYSGQFEGPGTRRISVIAQGADGTIEAMTQTINVVECAGDVVPPILVGQINWYRPDVANFAVRNAVDFEDGTQTYHWDFGDGTTSDTDVPVVSHDYQAALGITELRHNFDVTVTVSRPGLANSSAQRTFSLINTYVMSKQRGSIEPPVEFASPALEVDGSELVGTATITNREPSAMTFTSETIEYLPCDVNAAATHRTSSTISETVAGGSSLVYEARIAGSSMAATECGISVQLAGTTTDGQLVDSRLAFERPTSLDTGAPVSDAMASILNYVVAQGLVSDPTLITEEELVDLYRARKIPLSATAESFLQAAPAPGDRCDPNNPGTPPESGYSCQPTGAWDTESASWTDPANAEFAPRSHLANAYKGDVLLSRSCNGPVTPIMNTLDQIYTHAGMMTNNMFDLRNSSAEVDWLMKHGNGVMGSPSDGFNNLDFARSPPSRVWKG